MTRLVSISIVMIYNKLSQERNRPMIRSLRTTLRSALALATLVGGFALAAGRVPAAHADSPTITVLNCYSCLEHSCGALEVTGSGFRPGYEVYINVYDLSGHLLLNWDDIGPPSDTGTIHTILKVYASWMQYIHVQALMVVHNTTYYSNAANTVLKIEPNIVVPSLSPSLLSVSGDSFIPNWEVRHHRGSQLWWECVVCDRQCR